MNADERRTGGSGFAIRSARANDLPMLREIERRAAKLFEGFGIPESVRNESTPIEELEEARSEGVLWVAVSESDEPIGFACVEVLGNQAHLEELDVDPRQARRGVGSALVRTVCAWAAERGLRGVTLTTYRDIPFNAPFYQRLGFTALADHEISAGLRSIVREEAERGLDPKRRVVMLWECGEALGPVT